MKRIVVCLLCSLLLFACGSENNYPELIIEETDVLLYSGKTISVKIQSGSGDYEVLNLDNSIVVASIGDNSVIIHGLSEGEAEVVIKDVRSHKLKGIKVVVSSKRSMTFSSSSIIDFLRFENGELIETKPSREIDDYWGSRISDNTPLEIIVSKDNLVVIKPYEIVENYKLEWRNKEMFIFNQDSNKWRYCGEETDDGTIILNLAFYKIHSNNQFRTLMSIAQDYSLVSIEDLGDLSNKSVLWTRMNFLFVNPITQ